MRKMLCLLLVAILPSCGHEPDTEAMRLNAIDSLVIAEQYDSAYHEIMNMDSHLENDEDKAHYQLLLVQTSYLTDNTLSTDVIIDSAITYYEKSSDMNKLSDSYYYKAACLRERGNLTQAIQFYKRAEEVAQNTSNLRLQYKIAEALTKINNQSGNNTLQLDYGRKALEIALKSGNKNWIAYSYFNLSMAFQDVENIDSLSHYAKDLIPRLGDIYPEDLPYFLSCIGFMYFKQGKLSLAKKYYKESLSHQEIAHTLGNLADVYLTEGNEDEAYKLWQKAFLLDDGTRKDVIMFDMLQYDLKHGQNLENACERMYDIFTYKDSLTNAMKDHTILEMQHDYDEEAQNHIHEKAILKWMIATLVMALLLLLLLGYIKYKQYLTKLTLAKHRLLINQYNSEIKRLEDKCRVTEQDIRKNQALEETCKKAEREIDELKNKIANIVENASPILNRGQLLYDNIMNNKTTAKWSKEDYKCFLEYYRTFHLMEYEAIEKKHPNLTIHNTFFLVLCEIGKDNKAISKIMGISEDSVRSIKYRVKKSKNKTK